MSVRANGRGGLTALLPTPSPARPGPGPVPEAVLRAGLPAVRRVDGLLTDEHRSWALGAGTELSLVRPYVPGDDVRLIDPNATARTGEPHVRAHVAQRTMTAWIVLDLSPSMNFGTADRRKFDVAAGVALALGRLTTRGGNRLGITTFGGRETHTLAPRGGKRGMLGLANVLGRGTGEEGRGIASLEEALERTGRLAAKRRGFVALVSDFRGPRGSGRALAELAGRHDVVALEVRDPREQELPDVGDLLLVDPETGRQLRADTGSRRLRERFASEASRERDELASWLRRSGARHLVLSTRGDWLGVLVGFLRREAPSRGMSADGPTPRSTTATRGGVR